jgi:hypothetical protein
MKGFLVIILAAYLLVALATGILISTSPPERKEISKFFSWLLKDIVLPLYFIMGLFFIVGIAIVFVRLLIC